MAARRGAGFFANDDRARLHRQIFLQQSAEFLRQHPDLVAAKDGAAKPAAAAVADGTGGMKPLGEEEGWDISYARPTHRSLGVACVRGRW